jgi:hypothetical protein
MHYLGILFIIFFLFNFRIFPQIENCKQLFFKQQKMNVTNFDNVDVQMSGVGSQVWEGELGSDRDPRIFIKW